MRGDRRIRPIVWIIVGGCLAVGGAVTALASLATAVESASVSSARPCVVEFDDGCTTERGAWLERRRKASRRGYWALEWVISVPDGGPTAETQLVVEVPRQDGERGLHVGDSATVVYLGRSPVWLRSSIGAVLETGAHPRRRALSNGSIGFMLLGGGAYAVRAGFESVWKQVSWWQRTPLVVKQGPEFAICFVGFGAMFGALVSGGLVWPQLVGGVVGGVWILVMRRRWVAPRR